MTVLLLHDPHYQRISFSYRLSHPFGAVQASARTVGCRAVCKTPGSNGSNRSCPLAPFPDSIPYTHGIVRFCRSKYMIHCRHQKTAFSTLSCRFHQYSNPALHRILQELQSLCEQWAGCMTS